LKRIFSKLIFYFIDKIFNNILSKYYLTKLDGDFTFSLHNNTFNFELINGGYGNFIPVSNHSKGYHGILEQFIEKYKIKGNALLISESKKVASEMSNHFKALKFKSTDYYLDLKDNYETDFLWNLYDKIPDELKKEKFDIIISQATFEHIMDPISIIKKFKNIITDDGYIYVHTHTQYFPYHPWPKDYLRFQIDWFLDLEKIVPNIKLIELISTGSHIFSLYKKW